jgi:hypothetical protein
MSSRPLHNPASDILKSLGITEIDHVLRYSLHFSAEDVTVCRVDVAVCRDPLQAFEEQIKSYKVTLEPLDEPAEPSAEPELFMLQDGPRDLSIPPDRASWGEP